MMIFYTQSLFATIGTQLLFEIKPEYIIAYMLMVLFIGRWFRFAEDQVNIQWED